MRVRRVKPLARFPHGPGHFTQGLLAHEGLVLESTGGYGSSSLVYRNASDMGELARYRLRDSFFAEDLCPADPDGIIVLGWREGLALRWDVDAARVRREIGYDRQGWGIVRVDDHYVTSDGSSTLTRRRLDDLAPVDTVEVYLAGEPLAGLNAMAWSSRDTIWANIYGRDWLAEIDPDTGQVGTLVDATVLRSAEPPTEQADPSLPQNVLNGVCQYTTDTLLLTGKHWTWMHQVALEPTSPDPAALEALLLEMPRAYFPDRRWLMTRRTYHAQPAADPGG